MPGPSSAEMYGFVAAALCLFQVTYAESNFHDLLSPFTGNVHATVPPASTAAAKTTRNASSMTSPNADDQDADDRKGFGLPCALDGDCMTGRGLSCQEWVCACAPNSPVKVQVQGIDTCLPAKALYESCRYHEECSHRSVNMRCIDFLCYCPLPFELRGNGDCLAPKPDLGKLIAAVTPTSLLIILVAGIGGAFIFRRLFPSDDKKNSTTTALRRHDQRPMSSSFSPRTKVPSNSISVRMGPLKSLRAKKPNMSLQNDRTSAPSPLFPSTRLLRVPPDQLRPDAFSPGPTSTTTAMRTSSFSPPVPFAKSSQMLDKTSVRSTAPPQPARLSTTLLINKLLSSSADTSDEDNIVVRVLDYNPASQSKSWKQPQRTSLPFTATDSERREGLPFRKRDGCPEDDGSSLPIEWGTSTSNWDRRSSLAATAAGGRQVATKEGLKDGRDDDLSGRTLFSSFRQSKNVTFLDEVSPAPAAGRSHLKEDNTPGQVTAKPSTTFAERERGMKIGSLKAETRWLCQNEPVCDTEANAGSSGRQLTRKSEPACTEQTQDIAAVKKDETDIRTGDRRVQLLSPGARNRLGLGTPFVGPEEGSLAESASIPLSFLSSSSPSFEVLPKPDISSVLLREADALLQNAGENEAAVDSQEQEDASLVADFMAAVLHGESSSDGAAAPLSALLGGAMVPRDVKQVAARVAKEAPVEAALRVPSAEKKAAQSPRLSSPCGGQKVLSAAVAEAPKGDSPKAAVEITAPAAASGADRCAAAATEPPTDVTNYDDKAGQSVESTPSSTDIENLAEILNRLKITQLGNEHHRRERTLQREYGLVAPTLPGLTVGPRWPKFAANTVTVIPAVELGAGLGATRPSVETAVAPAKASPLPSPPCVPTVAEPAPRTTPTLPPLKESHEYSTEPPPSGEGSNASLPSDFRTPAEIQSESSQDDEAERDAAASAATTTAAASEPPVQRRRPSPAQLHRARTASSRLVPPAVPSSRHPVPLKRSIRFRRTTASQLQVIAEVFHGAHMFSPTPLARKTPAQGEGERLGGASPEKAVAVSPVALGGNIAQPLEGGSPPEPKARADSGAASNSREPREDIVVATTLDFAADAQDTSQPTQPRARAANVRSEPLRARSPFAMRKHFSEPLNAREFAAVADKTGHRDREWSLNSPFRSSELDSLITRSSSAARDDCTYDTDALMPSSIPTITATSERDEEASRDDPTLSSSLCKSHSRHRIPAYVLLPPADNSLYAAGSTPETDVHLSAITADSASQPEILDEAAEVAKPPTVVPRVRQRIEAANAPVAAAVGNSAAPKERKTRKSRANLQAKAAGQPRPMPLPRRIKEILSSNVSSVWRTSRDNTTVTVCATFAETLTVETSPTPRISPSTSFPVSTAVTLSSCKVHASATYGSRQRDTPTSLDRDDQATGAATCTSAIVEASSCKSESKPARRNEKKATRKNSSLPRFFFGRHRDSDGGDDASSVRSESSGTTDGLRLSVIMAKLGIRPSSHRFFSSSTTTTGTGGSSLETVLPSRHGAGDRGGHFSNADGPSSQRAISGPESGGAPRSTVLPRVWPEPSTSFSVVETSDTESIIVDDSCADALSFEREVLRRERMDEQRRRSASPPRSPAYAGAPLASPDPEWYSCSSRMSDRPPPLRSRARKTSD